MRLTVLGVFVAIPLAIGTVNGGDKKEKLTILKRADLQKLEGMWELKAEPKEGWKGRVRATIKLYPAGGEAADFGNILFDFDLTNGKSKLKVSNAPAGGIDFTAVKRGDTQALVTDKNGDSPPFKVKATDGLIAPFEVKGDKLTLDLSKSLKAFVPGTARELKIDWSKTTWAKVKK